ncbi:MAG: phosphatidate cytidylyltransferase [bacterium]
MKKFFAPLLFLPFLAYTTFIEERIFFTILIGSVILLGLFEFYNMVQKEDWWFLGLLVGILLIGSASLDYKYPFFLSFLSNSFYGAIISFFILLLLFFGIFIKRIILIITNNSIIAVIFGIFYIGWLTSHLILIRGLFNGSFYLLYLFSVVWSADGGGWLIGKHLGKHRNIFPISPNKSIEGLIGAIVSSVAISIFIGHYIGFSLLKRTLFGILFAFIGLFGDLAESIFKRNVGKKDSDSWISEYGGILDVFDSIIISAPIFYYLILLGGVV